MTVHWRPASTMLANSYTEMVSLLSADDLSRRRERISTLRETHVHLYTRALETAAPPNEAHSQNRETRIRESLARWAEGRSDRWVLRERKRD